MAIYSAPTRDMSFVLHELLDVQSTFAELPGFEEATADLIDAVLEEGGKLCEEKLFPLLASGDDEGCVVGETGVETPKGFREAYRQLFEGGWMSLGCDPELGGQGMPHTVAAFFDEILQSSNLSLSLYLGLTRGAYITLMRHASEDLKAKYLPKMIQGEWTGVMCLTEPHCGTDLGLLRTKAVPNDDGSYRISGTKIFITGGDQDMTDNIVHLVLAKLPDAPRGVKGISLFLVPKFLVDDDHRLGGRNTFVCSAVEKKMGIKGAATCVMNYDEATGWLVGEPHRGLQAMFSMMNHERLMVGQQGLAVGEVAYQSAAAYAKERLQGRALSGAKNPEGPADPIIVFPDVRRMLLTARAYNEAARALFGWASLQVDISERHPDPQVREKASDRVALITPVVKAFFSDSGSEVANQCMQVFGGHGYIKEWGMEQLVRDARIAQIYEGANGIHALDLVGRKLPMFGGRLIDGYLEDLDGFVAEHGDDHALREFVDPLAAVIDRLREATQWIFEAAKVDPEEVGASSHDYLKLMGLTAFAHSWAQMAAVALPKIEGDNSGFYANKVLTARFFFKRLLPQSAALLESLRGGADDLMAMEAEAF